MLKYSMVSCVIAFPDFTIPIRNYHALWDLYGYLGEAGFIRQTELIIGHIHVWNFKNGLSIDPTKWDESDQTLFSLIWS